MALQLGTENKRQVYIVVVLFAVIVVLGGWQIYKMFSGPPAVSSCPFATATASRPAVDNRSTTPAGAGRAKNSANAGIDPTLHFDKLAAERRRAVRRNRPKHLLRRIRARCHSTRRSRAPAPAASAQSSPLRGRRRRPSPPAIDLKYFGYPQAHRQVPAGLLHPRRRHLHGPHRRNRRPSLQSGRHQARQRPNHRHGLQQHPDPQPIGLLSDPLDHAEHHSQPAAASPPEEGYILICGHLPACLFVLALSVAAPQVAKDIQRDREVRNHASRQAIHARHPALLRKFRAYPPNVDALVKTNNIRFLRKKYIDPTTGKDDWKPIHFGQNKAPDAMGFFGQPLAGRPPRSAGIGPSGGNGLNGASSIGGSGSAFGGGSTFAPGNRFRDQPASAPGRRHPGSPRDAPAPGGSLLRYWTQRPDLWWRGNHRLQPASPKSSILIYKKKAHYNEWEFVYDPLTDMKTVSGNTGNIGQPAGSTTTPIGGSGFGGSSGGSFGPGSGTGSNPPSAPPTSPQQ